MLWPSCPGLAFPAARLSGGEVFLAALPLAGSLALVAEMLLHVVGSPALWGILWGWMSSCLVQMPAGTRPGQPSLLAQLPLVPSAPLSASPQTLSLLLRQPMKPLKATATTSQPVLTLQQIETIFYKIQDIYEIHKEFYDSLCPKVQQWDSNITMGHLFQKLVRAFPRPRSAWKRRRAGEEEPSAGGSAPRCG